MQLQLVRDCWQVSLLLQIHTVQDHPQVAGASEHARGSQGQAADAREGQAPRRAEQSAPADPLSTALRRSDQGYLQVCML